jgi:two-component system sensor histidine kinase/response regulator
MFSTGNHVFAQHKRIDSLVQHLQTKNISPDDAARDHTELSYEYLFTNYFDAEHAAKSAINISNKQNNATLEAEAYIPLGYAYLYRALFDESFNAFKTAERISKQFNLKKARTMAYSGLGELYEERKEFNKAKIYYEQAFLLAKEVQDTLNLGNAYFDLFNISCKLPAQPNKEKYFEESRRYYRLLDDDESVAMLYLCRAVNAERNNEIADAFKSLHIYDSLLKPTGFVGDPADYYGTIAGCYKQQKKFSDAMIACHRVIVWCKKIDEHKSLADIYLVASEIKKAQKQFDSSRIYAQKAKQVYSSLGIETHLAKVLQQLISIDSAENNKDSLFFHMKEYTTLSTRLLETTHILEDEELATILQSEKNKEEKEELKNEDAQQQIIILIISIAAFIILIALLLTLYFFRVNRRLLKKERILQAETNAALLKVRHNDEVKNRMLAIISHDIRSPLTSLIGLLTAVRNGDITEQEYLRYLPLVENESQATLFLLDNLLEWLKTQMDGFSLNMESFSLSSVIKENVALYASLISSKQLNIINNVPDHVVVWADKNVMRVACRNVLSNAIKFSQRGKTIKFNIENADNNLKFSCCDEGTGIKPDILSNILSNKTSSTRGTEKEKGAGIGLLFTLELLKNMEAEYQIDSKPTHGTCFIIVLQKSPATT